MPEQKRGRDSSPETAALINASYCYHHFVSSWLTHSQEKHSKTEHSRGHAAVVPIGQQIRSSNP
eukprot:CAMPEP_0181247980 /NCGR_PEP_ID=MMETSP1096-20121128/44917_1 /TAXON_ID=156174 ORGANISM="Chrysochromulina ericina, Strain CCMP281" /NCGR_SAMPLE_ID=MMETSP1096 /ASSEMBLY_ACC=CAM_ASM_000453 /LENGTH=63 /DNA_ID=CAMNT_0023345101 /DNA_START=41 /DNA_END=228 /DNA_ORIENTATION=-